MIDAVTKELQLRRDYLEEKKIQTIYFGGGTPSLLTDSEINRIIEQISQLYDLSILQEVTLEANPDDLSKEYTRSLKHTIINRLSIGIQSFVNEDLLLMNRSHNANEAEHAIKRCQDAGLDNISCDLIFGTPTLSNADLQSNIQKLSDWNIPHISAYALTIEERTALAVKLSKGTFRPSSENIYEQQMLLTMSQLAANGYEQYEISNYARDGKLAIHNTNYWKGVPYLGIGPSAHSYDGRQRSWNVRNNTQYTKGITEYGTVPSEQEHLSLRDMINEYIMVSLRTKWGLDLEYMVSKFDSDIENIILTQAREYIQSGEIIMEHKKLTLSNRGKLIADRISSELFITN